MAISISIVRFARPLDLAPQPLCALGIEVFGLAHFPKLWATEQAKHRGLFFGVHTGPVTTRDCIELPMAS